MIDLTPQQISIVQSILHRYIPEKQVMVFGSRTKGTAKPHSDLDLCVMGEPPVSQKILTNLEEAFSESDLPMKVDVIQWATISESFRKHIEKDMVVFLVG